MTRAASTALVLGILIAGCGAAGTSTPAAVTSRPSVQPAAREQPPWPPGGSPALARSVGRRMLASMVLPPGSRHVGARRMPERAEVIGSNSLVDLSSFFVVPISMQAVAAFLNGNPPAGFLADGTGTTSSRQGAVEEMVSYHLRAPPTGITSDSMLLVSLAAGPHGSTVARADAEVVWYPPRSAAEYLRAVDIRSARITATFLNPRVRHFARVVTSRRAIARLAALLNGMRATDYSARYCPMIDASYRVTFAGRGGQPRVVVDASGCATDGVAVNGAAQPPLWDPANRLIKALHRLLRLSPRYR